MKARTAIVKEVSKNYSVYETQIFYGYHEAEVVTECLLMS
jgi:hypothetical protein